jgi:hypothetical protein
MKSPRFDTSRFGAASWSFALSTVRTNNRRGCRICAMLLWWAVLALACGVLADLWTPD